MTQQVYERGREFMGSGNLTRVVTAMFTSDRRTSDSPNIRIFDVIVDAVRRVTIKIPYVRFRPRCLHGDHAIRPVRAELRRLSFAR